MSRAQRSEVVRGLWQLAEPIVEREGYELVEVELATDRGGAIVRLYVDTVPPSDESRGVSVDDCSRVSRRVAEALDVVDPIEGEYRLEVSSPGLFRPLTKPEHFERALGARVKVKTYDKLDGRRVFVGELQARTEGSLRVEVDGADFEVPLEQIARANLEPLLD